MIHKTKIDKLDFIKMCNFLALQCHCQENKKTAKNQEKMFAKRLLSKTYKIP